MLLVGCNRSQTIHRTSGRDATYFLQLPEKRLSSHLHSEHDEHYCGCFRSKDKEGNIVCDPLQLKQSFYRFPV